MKLPPHMSIKLSCYVRSDSAEAGADIGVGGCVDTAFLDDIKDLEGFTKAACAALNETLGVTDARPMTADEVREYLDDKDNDEREAGRSVQSARLSDLQEESDGV